MTTPSSRPVAVVDFADARGAQAVRRCFGAPKRVIRVMSLADVACAIDEAEGLARAGDWVVGYVAYEAAPAFDRALAAHPPDVIPLAWFAAFDAPLSEGPSPQFRAESAGQTADRVEALAPTPAISDEEFSRHLARIHALIAAGDVYQVNLTIPFTASSSILPLDLYERMRLAQGGCYSAFLDIGEVQIMSASPELFLSRSGHTIESRPMKGTAARALNAVADRATREELLRSEKDRAENVMIVDVVRNDMGRVAVVGTVTVSDLCEAERFPSVWQLTSTVSAEVSADLRLSALFRALFPAASITGAPKVKATEIIRELEKAPRGVYCGAVGYMRPGGDACFNVAIRTAWTDDGGRTVHLNAGGGVTIDSTPLGELAEVRAKVAAFTSPIMRPTLFETIRVEDGRPMRLARHLQRMTESADYFGIPFDASCAEDALFRSIRATRAVRAASPEHATRIDPVVERARLLLEPSGSCSASVERYIDDWQPERARVVSVASIAIDRHDVRLYHKTTTRETYDAALASAPEMFDVVLWNREGQATELTRGNLVAELDGALFTPPISCGLLGGTLRGELVDAREVGERVITLEELRAAERLWFVNALRGWVPVRLNGEAD